MDLELLSEAAKVLELKDRLTTMKTIGLSLILIILISWGLVSCGDRIEPVQLSSSQSLTETVKVGKLAEVAPPVVIEQLKQILDQYQPQVSIIAPVAEQVLSDTSVQVKLQVQDLPIFQDSRLEMGPHLHLILDNEPYQSIYDLNNPITLENLAPGTHTLRVFAVRPWHESFKNDEAYAQTTFHVLTKTEDNHPVSQLPLLTYSRPKGNYGAEPIMLDFYLTNAPLHLVAQQNPEDDIKDWRIRVTINGESFLLDDWQTVYLKGFEPGENWIKLEFLDEQGNLVKNAFNNTVRVINYQPQGEDTLAQLMRGELPLEQAKAMVIANYQAPPLEIPTPEAETELEVTTETETSIVEEEIQPETVREIPEIIPNVEANQPQESRETKDNSLTVEEEIQSQSTEVNPVIETTPVSETETIETITPEESIPSSEIQIPEPVQEQTTQPEIISEPLVTPILETPEASPLPTEETVSLPTEVEVTPSESEQITEEETILTNEPVTVSKSQPQWLKNILDLLPKNQ